MKMSQLEQKFPTLDIRVSYDFIPHLVWITDLEGSAVYINKKYRDYCGVGEFGEELLGFKWVDYIHPEDKDRVAEMWSTVDKTDIKNYGIRFRLKRTDGTYLWHQVYTEKSNIPNYGEVWVGTNTNIDDEINIKTRLRKLKEDSEYDRKQLESALQQLPLAIIIARYPDGKVLFMNEKFIELWGGEKNIHRSDTKEDYDEWSGWNPDGSKMRSEDWPVYRTLQNKETVKNQIVILKDHQRTTTVSVSSRLVYKDDGEPLAAIAICEDLNEQLALQQKATDALSDAKAAQESNRLKSQFIANVSHDIRTPLNGMLGSIQLMMQTTLHPSQFEYVSLMEECCHTLMSLINDILDLSKMESGKLEIESIPFSIEELAQSIYRIVSAGVRQAGKNLKVLLETENLPPYVLGDRKRVEQIVSNLVSNSIKFTFSGGTIKIRFRCTDDQTSYQDNLKHVILHGSVEDNGIGMTKDVQGKIFKAFVQADSSTTRKFGGSGLGLSICKDLCALMKGNIWVESIPNKGSVFHFNLPFIVADVDEKAMEKTDKFEYKVENLSKEEILAKRSNFKVLLAEDNKVSAIVAQRLMESYGYTQVTLAADGIQAVERFYEARMAKKEFDLVLMDCQMPLMDGYEASSSIRKISKVPIIAFTASITESERSRCFESGMNDIVEKPFKKETLVAILDSYVFA